MQPDIPLRYIDYIHLPIPSLSDMPTSLLVFLNTNRAEILWISALLNYNLSFNKTF
jgi:hypothetical protein